MFLIAYPMLPGASGISVTGKVNIKCTSSFIFSVLTKIVCYSGSQLRNWLLFYSLPVLRGVLPSEYLSHLALLIVAIHAVSSQHITSQDLHLTRCLLHQFYEHFSVLYGKLQ